MNTYQQTGKSKKQNRNRIIILIIILVAAALAVTGVLLHNRASSEQQEEPLLREYAVTKDDITAGITCSGILCVDGGRYILAQVAQNDVLDITEGQEAQIQFDARPEDRIDGVIEKIEETPIQSASGVLYPVRIGVGSKADGFFDGMTCGVRIVLRKVEGVLQVSNKAIQRAEDGTQYALVKDANGELKRQAVETGFSDGKVCEVVSGLTENETVYVEG